MSKKKGGGGKGQEESKLEIMARIAPKKFLAYGIPLHKQFMARIDSYLEDDSDFEQVSIGNLVTHLGGGRS